MDMIVAVHEAGHAWAYRLHRKPLRYVTIRPRGASVHGACQAWKPRRLDVRAHAFIAAAGPIAEAMYLHANNTDPSVDWEDHLTGAVLGGGGDDLPLSRGLLDTASDADPIKGELLEDWLGVMMLAERLVEARTVSGRDAFALLGLGETEVSTWYQGAAH